MKISLRLYRDKEPDIMDFLYMPDKGKFNTSLIRDILRSYAAGSHTIYHVQHHSDPAVFPEMKLLTICIDDKDLDIISLIKTIPKNPKGMISLFIKTLIRKYTGTDLLEIFLLGNFPVKTHVKKAVQVPINKKTVFTATAPVINTDQRTIPVQPEIKTFPNDDNWKEPQKSAANDVLQAPDKNSGNDCQSNLDDFDLFGQLSDAIELF